MNPRFTPLLRDTGLPVAAANTMAKPPTGAAFEPFVPQIQKPPQPEPTSCGGKPSLSLEGKDGHITHIRIKCSCGETILVECRY